MYDNKNKRYIKQLPYAGKGTLLYYFIMTFPEQNKI